MEHRMKLTDIKTARTHRESFPFLRANIQRLVGVGERETGRECAQTAQKRETSLNPHLSYQSGFLLLSFKYSKLVSNSDIKKLLM